MGNEEAVEELQNLKYDNVELQRLLEDDREIINRQNFRIETLERSRKSLDDDEPQDTPLPPTQPISPPPSFSTPSPPAPSTPGPSVELKILQSKFADLAVKMQDTFDTTMNEAVAAQEKVSRAQDSKENFRKKISQLEEKISLSEKAVTDLER